MSTIQAIKQLEERSVRNEIVLMIWSDRMDLVALANIKGEVALHRLTWTTAWSLRPPKDSLTVKNIVWRPDGKIIAIAYSSGQIILVKVENKNILHSIETKSDISCMSWIQDRASTKGKSTGEECKQNQYMKYIDFSSDFLPKPVLQQFDSSNSDDGHKINLLQEQNDLNLLLIGTRDGLVHIQIFGCFPCTILDLKTHLSSNCSVESIHLKEDLSQTFITVRDSEDRIKLLSFSSEIFFSHTNELFALSLKYIKLTSLLTYLQNTITTITESWESILLEMDDKLSKYASKVPEGGVTADFLELLVFGICSDEMKAFLIHDLTKKGLEKFGQTIEISYTNIQKSVQKYLIKYGQNVTYHLAEARGMARLEHRYKVLGLEESAITAAILSNGAFLIKAGEMQQIINHSITNYKAFFRWLYTAIVHVLEEQAPDDITKITQQDLAYITEFLQNFDKIGKNAKQEGFVMERLGQYLKDERVSTQPSMAANEWSHFLKQNKCMEKNSAILTHDPDMSLLQQYKQLKKEIDEIFTNPKDTIGRHFRPRNTFDCFQNGGDSFKVTQMNITSSTIVFCFLQPPRTILLLQLFPVDVGCSVKAARLRFTHDLISYYNILDVKLYSPTVLSVLLQESNVAKVTVLCQVPLSRVLERCTEVKDVGVAIFSGGDIAEINGSGLTPRLFKTVEGMTGAEFAVSGTRKVGIVLAENRRKVRLYEMEGEEEEDEDADMNSTIKETDDMNMTTSSDCV